jgi:hypothetical protein
MHKSLNMGYGYTECHKTNDNELYAVGIDATQIRDNKSRGQIEPLSTN